MKHEKVIALRTMYRKRPVVSLDPSALPEDLPDVLSGVDRELPEEEDFDWNTLYMLGPKTAVWEFPLHREAS